MAKSDENFFAIAAVVVVGVGGYYAYRLYRASGASPADATTNALSAASDGGAALPSAGILTDPTGALGLTAPLGLRLHNPGNLRFIQPDRAWTGQLPQPSHGFGEYETDEKGVRAMGHQLMAYYRRGLTTVQDIVGTWAPRSENDTNAYIAAVCQRMGVLSNSTLSLPDVLGPLMAAMIEQEQGYNPFNVADLQEWGTEL